MQRAAAASNALSLSRFSRVLNEGVTVPSQDILHMVEFFFCVAVVFVGRQCQEQECGQMMLQKEKRENSVRKTEFNFIYETLCCKGFECIMLPKRCSVSCFPFTVERYLIYGTAPEYLLFFLLFVVQTPRHIDLRMQQAIKCNTMHTHINTKNGVMRLLTQDVAGSKNVK